jgi:hypothetical protein
VALPTPRLSRVAGKHHNTSRDEGQQLPEREPDAAKPSPDHEHDEQEEERDQGCHVLFPHLARATLRAASMRSSLLALRKRARRVVLASVRIDAIDPALDVVLAHTAVVVTALQ